MKLFNNLKNMINGTATQLEQVEKGEEAKEQNLSKSGFFDKIGQTLNATLSKVADTITPESLKAKDNKAPSKDVAVDDIPKANPDSNQLVVEDSASVVKPETEVELPTPKSIVTPQKPE